MGKVGGMGRIGQLDDLSGLRWRGGGLLEVKER